jgi:hypothetical protein
MASNYTGTYTNVQAPATAPAVNNSPVVSLIQDADGNTAANLYQAWKVCADNLDLLLKMFGGTLTAKGIQADGTGGLASTVGAGVIQSKALTVNTASAAFNPGSGHIGFRGTTPVVSIGGAGAGTGPTVGIDAESSDTRGVITVTTGTAPAASGGIITVTFANAFPNLGSTFPLVFLSPYIANATSTAAQQVITSVSTTFFTLVSGSTPLAASTQYSWRYLVIT